MALDGDGIWYVAYGSNLWGDRLQRYLDLVSPVARPMESRAMRLDHRLFFAHESQRWGGGTAFVDPTPDPGARTRATAWRLRPDQFLGVLAGENGRTSVELGLDDLPTRTGTSRRVLDARYGLVLTVPSPDDRPAWTVTTPEVPLPSPTRPVRAYVDAIVTGLVAGHGLSDDAARGYLGERGGTPTDDGLA